MLNPTRLLGGLLLAPALLLADFSYTEITRITGGMMMSMSRALGGLSKDMKKVGEPTTSSVYLKGNRMATVNDHTGHIVDLDNETMTEIDFDKRTYATITFAQMKEAMQKAMQKAQGQMSEAKQKQEEAKAKQGEAQGEVNFRIDVKETGKVAEFGGVSTREMLLTLIIEGKDKKSGESGEMQTMNSIWLADTVPGYEQIGEFQKRMALKLASVYADTMMAQKGMPMAADPRFRSSMQQMAKEMEKLKGVHIRQVTKMGMNLDPAKASEVTDPSTMPEGPTAGNLAGRAAESSAQQSAASRLGRALPGGLGGLGGFGRRKQKEQPPPPAPDSQAGQQGQQGQQQAILMEMVQEMSNFSNGSVDPSKVAVPSGFQQTEHPMMKAFK